MQPSVDENLPSHHSHLELFKNLKVGDDDVILKEEEAEEEEEEEDEENDGGMEEEEEFSFMCGEANSSPIAAEDAFINGQIKPVFPLFNRDLLFPSEDLPMRPPVKKVLVETSEEENNTSSSDWSNRKAVDASPEVCKKSNSTGFSKIWRFKDFLGRSNSDGRDAFVFLNSGVTATTVAEKGGGKKESSSSSQPSGKVKAAAATKKGKTASLSAHEVYLRSKAKEEDRRRSFLPYRPELMGFFTNVNGGLSKNVHPF